MERSNREKEQARSPEAQKRRIRRTVAYIANTCRHNAYCDTCPLFDAGACLASAPGETNHPMMWAITRKAPERRKEHA